MARRPVRSAAKPAPKRASRVKPAARKSAPRAGVNVKAGLADTREWLSSIDWNARTATALIMIVLGVFTLAPAVQNWFTYQQKIADMRTQVQQTKDALAQMKTDLKRWDDPVYVRTQARQRLYYVLPGEISYLVMDAGSVNTSDTSGTVGAMLADKRNNLEISKSITSTKDNWVDEIVGSVVRAGIEQPSADATK
ncbi:MAG: FtsB family cell division protein [Micrococcales bacterium]